jgi:T5SS/PEP-CTERM-associated repeat protein
VLAIVTVGLFAASIVRASAVTSGDVLPGTDPLTWTKGYPGTFAYVGQTGIGSMTIDGGTKVLSSHAYIGYYYGNKRGTGAATVTGAGSTWTGMGDAYVGYIGTGNLTIAAAGAFQAGSVTIGSGAGGSGKLIVDGAGSTLSFSSSNSNFTVGAASGVGMLVIRNGGSVYGAATPLLGTGNKDDTGASGTVIVDGANSTWATVNDLVVGHFGTGRLTITNGGRVASGAVYQNGVTIGALGTATGTATVSGAGSTWTVTGATGIKVGNLGTGRLSISDGGAVTASTVNINGSSTLTTDVGRGSSLAVSGDLTNNGTIRLVAGAHAASGTYTPITAGSWTGGTTQALGGVLNADNSMTVNPAVSGTIGTAATINLAAAQRVIFSDGAGKAVVGAGFQAGSGSLSLTATSMSDTSSLEALLASGQSVLSGWDFTASGYTEGSPVYLSLYAGSGQDLSDLSIWHYGTNGWTAYDASDLAYDGTYASFTVTGFSGYAVAGNSPVPVPAAAWLLGSGLFGLAGLRKKFGR